MSAKKYFFSLSGLLFVFMALNLIMWHGFVKERFLGGKDLNRLGSYVSTKSLTPEKNYSRHHVEFSDYLNLGMHESFDLITIGDSFSGCGYQDYLTEKYDLKILNFHIKGNCLEDLYILINSGLLDELKPKFIIIESVGRSVQNRLGKSEINANLNEPIISASTKNDNTAQRISSGFFAPVMIKVNCDFLYNFYNFIYRIFNPEQLSPLVYINALENKFFTNPGCENILLSYFEDLNYLQEPLNPAMIHANINNAANILSEKKIKLLFMPCVDKYDLYYPYLIDKHGRPENNLFAELDAMPGKNYIFVNTKQILRKALEQGEKDLYWFADTHWSWRGFQIVCDEIMREIL